MNISGVRCQQHQVVEIWSDVCFSGGMGSKPRGLLTRFLLPRIFLFNNPPVSAHANSDEATPEEVKAWLDAGLTKLEEITKESPIEERVARLEAKVATLSEILLLMNANCIKEIVEMQAILEFALEKENRGKITVDTASELLNSKTKAVRRLYALRQLGLVVWRKAYYSVATRKTGLALLKEILDRRYLLILNKVQKRYIKSRRS